MDRPHRTTGKTPAEEAGEDVLRAKYLDYCSAQLADLLLYLSPDEIFTVAERVARDRGASSAGSYSEMVATATEWVQGRVSLPPFEVWVKDYRSDPEKYDRYLMGLWRDSGTGESSRTAGAH